jgi:hypothetical protein
VPCCGQIAFTAQVPVVWLDGYGHACTERTDTPQTEVRGLRARRGENGRASEHPRPRAARGSLISSHSGKMY